LRRYEEAIRCYDEALNIEPNNADVLISKNDVIDKSKLKKNVRTNEI
jgi:tetratricopeptide (TPR) repeat protein